MKTLLLILMLFSWLCITTQGNAQRVLDRSLFTWTSLQEPGNGGAMTAISVNPNNSNHVLVGGDMLGVALSLDGGESWLPTFGFKSWEIADFTWHPVNANVVWVGTMSGAYLSVDGGTNWQAKRNGMPAVGSWFYSAPIQKVLFDPNDPTHLIAVGGSHRRWESPNIAGVAWGAVWESRDSGENWARIGTIGSIALKNITAAEFAAGSSQKLYAVVDQEGFFYSNDGGKNWTKSNVGLSSANTSDLATHPTNPNVLWVALDNNGATPGGIFKSTDGGLTWQNASTGLNTQVTAGNKNLTARYDSIAVSPTNPDVLMTCDISWNGSKVFVSRNGGASWQSSLTRAQLNSAMPAGAGMTVLAFDPKNSEALWSAGSEYLARSSDGGQTWIDATSKITAQASFWQGRGFAGWVTTNFKFDPRDANHAVLLGLDHANLWQSRDRLTTWRWAGTNRANDSEYPTWQGARDVAFSANNVLWVTLGQFGSNEGIARSSDGGVRWTRTASGQNGLASGMAWSVYALPDNANVAWATVGDKLCQTTDGGQNWKVVLDKPGLKWIAGESRNPLHFYVSGNDGVYETTDGATFALMAGSPTNANNPTKLLVDSNDRLYACAWRSDTAGGLWRWANGSWARLNDYKQIAGVAVDPTDNQRIVVATNDDPYHDESFTRGVLASTDGGKTWIEQNAGLPMLRGEVIVFNPHNPEQLVLGTNGRGFFVANWPKEKRRRTTNPRSAQP